MGCVGRPLVEMFGPPPKKNFDKKNKKQIGTGTTFRIGQEIQCLPYAGFFLVCFQKLVSQQIAVLFNFHFLQIHILWHTTLSINLNCCGHFVQFITNFQDSQVYLSHWIPSYILTVNDYRSGALW